MLPFCSLSQELSICKTPLYHFLKIPPRANSLWYCSFVCAHKVFLIGNTLDSITPGRWKSIQYKVSWPALPFTEAPQVQFSKTSLNSCACLVMETLVPSTSHLQLWHLKRHWRLPGSRCSQNLQTLISTCKMCARCPRTNLCSHSFFPCKGIALCLSKSELVQRKSWHFVGMKKRRLRETGRLPPIM